MGMTGSLETFSLPELFRLIDSGAKTGQLIIQPSLDYSSLNAIRNNNYQIAFYYIWFHKGRLITIINNRSDNQNLLSLIENQGWVSSNVLEKLAGLCPSGIPFGVYLQKMKVLKKEKLKLLFQLQLHQVHKLFELNAGQFQLNVNTKQHQKINSTTMPWLEMTGISMRALKVNMLSLRMMKNWSNFMEKLPEKSSALQQLIYQPTLQLTALEQEIWQMANNNISLEEFAQLYDLSLLETQKAAFRLMMARLVEEIPLANFQRPLISLPSPEITTITTSQSRKMAFPATTALQTNPKKITLATKEKEPRSEKPQISLSLVKKLVNFLRSRL